MGLPSTSKACARPKKARQKPASSCGRDVGVGAARAGFSGARWRAHQLFGHQLVAPLLQSGVQLARSVHRADERLQRLVVAVQRRALGPVGCERRRRLKLEEGRVGGRQLDQVDRVRIERVERCQPRLQQLQCDGDRHREQTLNPGAPRTRRNATTCSGGSRNAFTQPREPKVPPKKKTQQNRSS
jgi:hypothetical protein